MKKIQKSIIDNISLVEQGINKENIISFFLENDLMLY